MLQSAPARGPTHQQHTEAHPQLTGVCRGSQDSARNSQSQDTRGARARSCTRTSIAGRRGHAAARGGRLCVNCLCRWATAWFWQERVRSRPDPKQLASLPLLASLLIVGIAVTTVRGRLGGCEACPAGEWPRICWQLAGAFSGGRRAGQPAAGGTSVLVSTIKVVEWVTQTSRGRSAGQPCACCRGTSAGARARAVTRPPATLHVLVAREKRPACLYIFADAISSRWPRGQGSALCVIHMARAPTPLPPLPPPFRRPPDGQTQPATASRQPRRRPQAEVRRQEQWANRKQHMPCQTDLRILGPQAAACRCAPGQGWPRLTGLRRANQCLIQWV
jgi:hypothetical protein